jgi:hypothetical protein
MNKKIIIGIVAGSAALLVGGYLFFNRKNKESETQSEENSEVKPDETTETPKKETTATTTTNTKKPIAEATKKENVSVSNLRKAELGDKMYAKSDTQSVKKNWDGRFFPAKTYKKGDFLGNLAGKFKHPTHVVLITNKDGNFGFKKEDVFYK